MVAQPDGNRLTAGQIPPAATSGAVTAYNTLDAAVAATRRGWAVFPCRPRGKRPAVDDWERKACADPATVARYWPGPQHNVGIACGPSHLVVLDLDCHGDLPDAWRALPGIRDGRDVLAALCEWARQPWPSTHWVATPSGGWHLYFTAPNGREIRNSAGLLGPQVDVRAAGGYVVGAGSAVDGRPYEVLDDDPAAPLPGWLARTLTRPPEPPGPPAPGPPGSVPARVAGLVRTVEAAPQGQRNDTLYWSACRASELNDPVDREAAAAALLAAAITAGLTEHEARRTITSAMGGGG
jgi:Bifunctional DNA primase/polymerase, N-terminal